MSRFGRFLEKLPRVEDTFKGNLLAVTLGRAEDVDWAAGASALVYTLPFNAALVAATVGCAVQGDDVGLAASTVDVQVNGAGGDLTGSALDIPTVNGTPGAYSAMVTVLDTAAMSWIEYRAGTEFHVTVAEVITTEPRYVYVTLYFLVRGKPGTTP